MPDLLFIGVVVESERSCSDRCGHFRSTVRRETPIGVCGRCKLFGEFLMHANGPDWTPPVRPRRFEQCRLLAQSLVVVRAENAWHDWTDADVAHELRALPELEQPRLNEAALASMLAAGMQIGFDDDDPHKHQFIHICHKYPGKSLCETDRLGFPGEPIDEANVLLVDCPKCIELSGVLQ